MAGSLRKIANGSAYTSQTATGVYGTTISVTSTFYQMAVGDMLIAIAFDAYGSVVPTIAGGPGAGAWTVRGSYGGQPIAAVATKPVTATGTTAITATVPSTGMLYLFTFCSTGFGYLDDIEFGTDNSGIQSSTRVASTTMIGPTCVTPGATTTNPDLPISALCTFYDSTTTTPTVTAPSGASQATSTVPAAAGGYGTTARAYTYATITGANSNAPARLASSNRAVYSTNVQLTLTTTATVTKKMIDTLVDPFTAMPSAALWPTQNYISFNPTYQCAQVQAGSSGGSPQYASLRSALAYTFLGSTLFFRIPHFPDAVGDTVSSQIWIQPDQTPGVNRIGFEYVGATNQLIFRGQTTGYAAIGTDVSITYNANSRWLQILNDNVNGIRWYTSPDATNWTLQRTLPVASVPAWCNGTNTLQVSFEAYRTTGVNDQLMIDSVNVLPSSSTKPIWIISTAPTGKTTWVADLTKADAVAAGYEDDSWQRQNGAGTSNDTTVPWPPPLVPAPYGRAGSAVRLRMPDNYKRYEIMPPMASDYVDGDSFWEGFAFCLGPETDLIASGGNGYQVIWQLRPENSAGSPPVCLEVRNGALLLTGGYGRPDATGVTSQGSTYSYSQTLMTGIKTQTWYHVILFVGVWSDFNSGRIDVWVNGVNVLSNYSPPPGTNYPQPSGTTPVGSYPKCGIYHDPTNRAATNYIADHKVGTSYNAVDPTKPVVRYGGLEIAAAR